MYGPFTNEELVGRAIAGRRDRRRAGDEVRHRARRRTASASAFAATPSTSAAAARTPCGGSASSGSTSTTSTGSIPRCRSRRRSERWPSWSRPGKVAHLGLSEAAPETIRRAHADPPDRRPADRVLALEPRSRGRDPADGARAGNRLRRLQPARSRLPHRPLPLASRTCPRTISAASTRVSKGENLERNLSWSSASRRSPARRASRPGSWPWPGSSPRATTWSPSPGPSTSTT